MDPIRADRRLSISRVKRKDERVGWQTRRVLFPPDGYAEIALPALRNLSGKVLLAWNRRVVQARPGAERCRRALAKHRGLP